MSIKNNLEEVKKAIPEGVKLVVVSKQRPIEAIEEAYESGERIFAENRHKELIEKFEKLPKDIEWHFIGTLQRSNVKYVVPYATLIHSVDSQKLLEAINKEGAKNGKVVKVLLEIFIAQDETKSGWDELELTQYLESKAYKELENIEICGVMGMASYCYNNSQIESEFKTLATIFNTLKNNFFAENSCFATISAGMSGDYEIAIKCGSNMVRVGSSIFR